MARGDVFIIGDRVEYRTSYKADARYGVVVGFGRHSVHVQFEGINLTAEIKAGSAWLRPAPVDAIFLPNGDEDVNGRTDSEV